MDTQPLPIPRLRLTRRSTSPAQPVAGPSRLSSRPPVDLNSDDEDDPVAQSTPKISAIAPLPHVQIAPPQAETPAARLRALLSRVPNHSTSVTTVPPEPASPSEFESDFDVPQSALATPSIARESLKDLFSRALRDTPQKGRRRRNSIDVSEVEASPRVEKERAKNKGKRKSLSDEELEKPSGSSQRSETSFRSSQAATFNLLRERLTNSHINMDNSPPSSHEHDSIETEKFARDLNFSQTTPPAATSTPQRSVLMPSRSQLESNLLDQDSEMQRAMRGVDSYDDSGPGQRPLSFPPFHSVNAQSPHHPSHVKSHSHDSTYGTQHQTSPRDVHSRSSSRASSSHSVENKTDRDREREREWNRPHPKTLHEPTHRHSHGDTSRSVSPIVGQSHTLSRKGSAISFRSLDDGGSTRTSSTGSQADYRERMDDSERERNIEREREWNKRHPNVVRPASSLGLHSERTRRHSHTARPGSAQSHVYTDHGGFRGRLSVSPSPNSSIASQDSVREQAEEMRHEVERQLERNWNSPHPKQLQSHSSLSSHLHSHSHSPTNGRVRAESLKMSGTRAESPNHHVKSIKFTPRPITTHPSTNMNENTSHNASLTSTGRRTSPSLHRPMNHHARPSTPVPPPVSPPPVQTNDNKSQGSVRHGWQFPRIRTPLPPIEADQDSHSGGPHLRTLSSPTPSSRPPSRVSGSSRISYIPVKSPKKSHELPSTLMSISAEFNGRSSDSKRGHKRSTTELSEAVGRVPPHINESTPFMPSNGNSGPDSAPADDSSQVSRTPTSESDQEGHERISTPTIGPLDTPRAAQMILHNNNDEFRLQKALASPPVVEELSPLPSPPSETPSSPPQPTTSILSTPPRRPSSTSRTNFETPSPPHGLPELPDPPSSDDEVGDIPLTTNGDAYDLTTTKTPRPPGAWASTPTFRHSSRKTLARANSLPEDAEGSSRYDIGLATPAASLSRATSVPAQTPAPPGGWISTPYRKSILKVRFDVEPSENSVSESISEPSTYIPSDLKGPPWSTVDSTAGTSQMLGDATPFQEVNAEDIARAQTPEPHIVPVSPRSPRKPPSIRVVDAFGRERSVDGNGKQKDSDTTESRSRSTIRILDAMGREVEEVETSDKSKSEEDVPLKHNEALARVRKGIADLAEGLNDADRSSDDPLDEQYLNKLDGVSRTARDARHKISRTLHVAQETEDNLRSKFGSLKSSIKKSNFLPAICMDRRRPWLGWLFWGMVVLQILLIIIMYRISILRAKDMFLTTYYDPFYPDLHLYTTKPDTHYHSVTSSVSRSRPWPFFSTLDTIQREGWKTAAVDMWDTFALVIDSWQRQAWEAWGADDRTQSISWPPT